MVPILDRLLRESAANKAPLVGVRALLLYPLNALINSQRDRLHAWTNAFDGDVRFCLYNGNTEETLRGQAKAVISNEVQDRKTLRENPPPILVTNATMLEYMLVRTLDAPILEKSRGKLEWIVLDEAHSYIGSQAAELALLLRRVLYGFGVHADQVRFVATSATIGDPNGEAGEKLRTFLADLAGVARDKVHVVSGNRSVPLLPPGDRAYADVPLASLQGLASTNESDSGLFDALSANKTALKLRARFVNPSDGKPVAKLSEVAALLPNIMSQDGDAIQDALNWIDLLTVATRKVSPTRVEPFLPLRAHLFHQVLAGIWACADQACTHKKGTKLDDGKWPYGTVYLEKRARCECGAPAFEVQSCSECNETFLGAVIVSKANECFLAAGKEDEVDEFSLEVEGSHEETEDDHEQEAHVERVLIANGLEEGVDALRIDLATLMVEPPVGTPTLSLLVRSHEQLPNGQMALRCPHCKAIDSARKPLARRPILGAPFLLGQVIPTLLEYCEDGTDPLKKPFRGRRMITFTDSRQGTARIAAKIQQESERNRVRGLVYFLVARAAALPSKEDPQKRAHLDALRAIAGGTPAPEILKLIQSMEADIVASAQGKAVPFAEVADYLATNETDVKLMFEYYNLLDPEMFGGAIGIGKFSEMVLAREFARRPRRVNSAETMGLVAVQYRGLTKVTSTPPELPMSLSEWRDFLKIALDFFVRENSCVDLPLSWMKWGGNKIARKYLLGPLNKDTGGNTYMKWPQVGATKRLSRLVRLLAFAYKLDPTEAVARDTIDRVLRKAWDDLTGCGVLEGNATNGYFLPFKAMSFATVEKGWICPVTRRVLDTTLRGITPYLPSEKPTLQNALCREIVLPVCPESTKQFESNEARLHAIRDWLSGSPEVENLRSDGLWSDLNDRAVEGGAYFRAAEHSAQQPATRLLSYERAFKSGQLNLLSCSTTMEMGVDIGGISVVAMNNVPPHPANYLQRAGRAGRRSETRSVALTVCKNNPHDQAVFANTRWAFDTGLPMPAISLSSTAIVQRHVNSMLLSNFLRDRAKATGVDLNKLNCDWFFLPKAESVAEIFCNWADSFLEELNAGLSGGLRQLIRNTCFDGIAQLPALAHVAAAEIRRVRDGWYAEYDEITARMEFFATATEQKEPAFRALEIQRKRLATEYLLTELVSSGFLPGYGFPTHIASFDTLNVEELRRRKQLQGEHREDNRMRRRDLANRDLVTALREYAPGADVIIDGLVYRSGGITLNWHSPASQQDVREIQNIRRAWRCRACGASGTSPSLDPELHCEDCGKTVKAEEIRKFLEPAGFAVDLYVDVHNDISQQQFIAPEIPWIHAHADWMPLPNRDLGSFRASPDGSAFFQSSGVNGRGYAICLKCGKAEPMSPEGANVLVKNGHLPEVFRRPHTPLRGRRGGDGSFCEGSDQPWSILPSLYLGHEVRTDVLELHLRDLDGTYLNDEVTAFSIAVAIRSAIAGMLGVQDEELGCATKEVRERGDAICRSILIFDKSASGYVTAIESRIGEVLKAAADQLHCPKECDSACQHCLEGYGTRFQRELLNRHTALAFLSDKWLQNLRLPDDLAYFGVERSASEYQPLPEAIWREITKSSSTGLRLLLGGDLTLWDLPASSLRSYLSRWIGLGKPVAIMLTTGALAGISPENKRVLSGWSSLAGITIEACASLPIMGHGWIAAEVMHGDSMVRWAVGGEQTLLPGPDWGSAIVDTLVVGTHESPVAHAASAVTPAQLTTSQSRADSYKLDIHGELNGRVNGFGKRFWDHVCTVYPEAVQMLQKEGSELATIVYRDRYINAPLTVALLLELVSALGRRLGIAWEHQLVHVETVPLPFRSQQGFPNGTVTSDWQSDEVRRAAVRSAFAYCGIDTVDVVLQNKHDAEHARTLEITMKDGARLLVRFDQGVSYWKNVRSRKNSDPAGEYENRFDFDAQAGRQGEQIAELPGLIENQNYPTYIYLSMS